MVYSASFTGGSELRCAGQREFKIQQPRQATLWPGSRRELSDRRENCRLRLRSVRHSKIDDDT